MAARPPLCVDTVRYAFDKGDRRVARIRNSSDLECDRSLIRKVSQLFYCFSGKMLTFAASKVVPRLCRWHPWIRGVREESPGSTGRSTSENRSYW